jgi:LuxR family maltose regulon positive regulatory protein
VATIEGAEDAMRGVAAPETVMLETKLTRPGVRREHVARREGLARLRDAGPQRLTLVAAPPGFGKTTLLAQWVGEADGPAVAWLTVDEDDNDPARSSPM